MSADHYNTSDEASEGDVSIDNPVQKGTVQKGTVQDSTILERLDSAPLAAPIKGRLADKLAAMVAATALGLSILLSGLFFAGFVANDYHIFAITSALVLSLFLGGFAIVPMAIVTILARRAYRNGGNIQLYIWVLGLVLPWCILSVLGLVFTPLPIWMSCITVSFALILAIWGIISLILEVKYRRHYTL